MKRLAAWFLSFCILAPTSLAFAESSVGTAVDDFTLPDYLGTKHSLREWKDHRAVVVVFLGTECPLAKLYATRLVELAERYQDRSVQLVGINANRHDTLQKIGHYARVHKLNFPMLKDAGNKVSEQFAVSFRYRGDANAKTVSVAGSFNDWSKDRHLMQGPDDDGFFTTTINMKPGQHEYKFVINGEQWTHDPDNPIRKGPFNNTVVRVRDY